MPLAHVREVLGIEGMDVPTALNVRDKARMKTVLQHAGLPCARHQLIRHPSEALAFADRRRLPARREAAGWRRRPVDLPARRRRCVAGLVQALPQRPDDPALLEEFLSAKSTL